LVSFTHGLYYHRERNLNTPGAQVKNVWSYTSCIVVLNPLNVKLIPIYHLLALFGAHPIPHVSRIRVKEAKG
jgi:hypothetical protein